MGSVTPAPYEEDDDYIEVDEEFPCEKKIEKRKDASQQPAASLCAGIVSLTTCGN